MCFIREVAPTFYAQPLGNYYEIYKTSTKNLQIIYTLSIVKKK